MMNLFDREISKRLERIFLRDRQGHRPVYGGPRSYKRIRTGVITFCFTSTSTATTERDWGPVIRPDGPEW